VKLLISFCFLVLMMQIGCAGDLCESDSDCAPNQLCVDTGGVLLSGKECVASSGSGVSSDVAFDQSTPDLDAPPDTPDEGLQPDLGVADLITDSDPDLPCEPETDAEVCARQSAQCGLVEAVDRCGAQREAFCGACTAPESCNESNLCRCEPETDEGFCSRLNANCGALTAPDNCGNSRTASCGSCPNNQTCGESSPNLCGCPCQIGNTCYPEGAINSSNPCTSCQPDISTSDWSPRTAMCDDSNPCTVGDMCQNGACAPGGLRDCSAFDSASACQVGQCNVQTGACVASTAPDSSPCGPGTSCSTQSCNGGSCIEDVTAGCLISNTCYSAGATNPANACQVCTPNTSRTSWSNRTGSCDDGDTCTINDTCNAGVCQGTPRDCSSLDSTCSLGVCDTTGSCVAQPRNQGMVCSPSLICASNNCNNGSCVQTITEGCLIGNTCYIDGDLRPGNPCQVCDSSVSQTNWTNRNSGICNDGNNCTTGDSCSNGVCVGTPKDCSAFNSQCSVGMCGMSGNCYAAPINEGQPCVGTSTPCSSPSCVGGSCQQVIEADACLVNGQCHFSGQSQNCCEYCEPTLSQTSLQPRPFGYPCGSGCSCNLFQQCEGSGGQACLSQCLQQIE